MVLSIMRRHAKSWLIKFLIGIIAVVFIFYFGYSFTATRGLKIAYVNGELISEMEYQKAYQDLIEATRRRFEGRWNDDLIKALNLKQRALEVLIYQKLISQEAKKLGLDVTESESQKAIMSYPAFQIDGSFDIRRYQALLSQNRMKPEDFEASIALELLDAKLKQFLFSFLEVPEEAVFEYYSYDNEKLKIGFVQFKPDEFKKSVKFDKASLEKYFEENKGRYQIPEQIKLTFIEIDPERFRGNVNIAEKEVEAYYAYNPDRFVEPRQVKARHILLELKLGADKAKEEEVRKAAEAVLKEARQGKDFAELAKKYSQGPASSEGGDLGYFSEGQMEKPFEQAAFNLKKGEISDLVRTRFGYHIIKVEDRKEKRAQPLEEVREQIVEILLKNVSAELAHEKGLSLMDQMPYEVDLRKYAAQHELETKDTEYFSSGEPIPGVGSSAAEGRSLFSLDINKTSELFELDGKFYIFQVVDKKPSLLPELKEVEERVKEDFIDDLAAKEAKAAAQGYLEELRKGKPWDELAKERHVTPEGSGYFTRNEPIPKIGYDAGLIETAFGLNKDKRYPDSVFENQQGAYVIRWEGKKGIDRKEYEKEKEQYRFSLMMERHKRAYQNWLQDLKKNAEIEIVTPISN
ncbi:MAG: SurA N-terminal domain-containing protein [Pseudomonadota bacterium]